MRKMDRMTLMKMKKENMILEQEVSNIWTPEDLWDFWEEHPKLTIPKLPSGMDLANILAVLSREVDKGAILADVDLVIRSWTTSKKAVVADGKIEECIDIFPNRRMGRDMQKFLSSHIDELSLEKTVPQVLSRDYGETCVRITREAIHAAIEYLQGSNRLVSAATVTNYLYDTLPREPYLSVSERKAMGLIQGRGPARGSFLFTEVYLLK